MRITKPLSLQPKHLLILCWLLFATAPARSELISLSMPTGVSASALWQQGKSSKAPILILHGFLQTRDFFTVRRLGEALSDEGYSVLIPTLSLGIDNRRQSLECEAIHTHSLEQDVEEIAMWSEWLSQRTARPITLIGHSAGSLEALAYLSLKPNAPVERAILISLLAFEQGPIAKENEQERQRAQQQVAHKVNSLSSYRLAYCDSYTTTPENYLSYLAWNSNKTLEQLNKLAVEPIIILGGSDQRLGEDWLPRLRDSGRQVIEIPGANHFFDHEHEFNLMDSVLEILGNAHPPG